MLIAAIDRLLQHETAPLRAEDTACFRGTRIARIAVMPDFLQRHRGPRSQWAAAPRALEAIAILLSAAACSAARPAAGDDTGTPDMTSDLPGDAGASSTPGGGGATAPSDGPAAAPPLQLTFDGADHGSDACFAIAAGPGDSIIVTGETQRFAQGHNAWARAYDAAGGVMWTYELSTPSEGHDRGTGAVALAGGGAVIAGTWFSGSSTHWNSFALELSATGAPAWSQINEIIGDDRYSALARDAAGRLLVAGDRADAAGRSQAWLRALTATGSEQWSVARTGSAPGAAAATGIAVDSTGDVVAVGSETNADTGRDGWIAKYDPAGAPRWSIALAGPGSDAIAAVAIGPDDSIAVVGATDAASTIRVYDAGGAPRWDATAADGTTWSGVAVGAGGDVVVAGSAGADLVVRSYTAAGALGWQRTIAGARGQAVALDSRGNVLVCGAVTTAGNTDALILVFEP